MPKDKNSRQIEDFVKAARELGTDESEEAFHKVLKRVASAPAIGADGGSRRCYLMPASSR